MLQIQDPISFLEVKRMIILASGLPTHTSCQLRRRHFPRLASCNQLIANGERIDRLSKYSAGNGQEALEGLDLAIAQVVVEVHAGVDIHRKGNGMQNASDLISTLVLYMQRIERSSLTISSSVWLVPLG